MFIIVEELFLYMKKEIISIISSFLILLVIILIPANAIELSIIVPNTSITDDLSVNFIGELNINSNEIVPITNISAKIYDNSQNLISVCYFDINGNKLNGCDSRFTEINKIKDTTVENYGTLNSNGFNGSENVEENYGYGYGYGFSETVLNDIELRYNISWDAPQLQSLNKTYTVKLEANAEGNNVLANFKQVSSGSITIEMRKPIARIQTSNYDLNDDQKIIVNATSSEDLNGYNITTYNIYNQDELIVTSSTSEFEFSMEPGEYILNLVVVNEYGATSEPVEFEVIIETDFEVNNFNLDVNSFIEENKINFEITQLETFSGKQVSVEPQINCLSLDFEYQNADSSITLRETGKTFQLVAELDNFDLNVPMDNSCTFRAILTDVSTGNKITLIQGVTFSRTSSSTEEKQVTLNNGNDIAGYIATAFSGELDKGFNSLKFNFKNSGAVDIKGQIQVISNDLGIDFSDDLFIRSGSESKVHIPVYLSENVKKGKYPIRISYRIDNGDLKTKYGFVLIE